MSSDPLRAAAAHLFVDDLEHPVLQDQDRHHLRSVLRLRNGAAVIICDGAGSWRPARLGREGPEPVGPTVVVAPPAPVLTVGFAPPKGDRPEAMVRALTELGIDVVVPFLARRSVVRWDAARAEHRRSRLQRVAREAAMQSRRVHLPTVGPLQRLPDLVASLDLDRVAFADPAGGDLDPDVTATILVGPEGGWEEGEVPEQATVVRLGAGILRCETAALAAGALLGAARTRQEA